ncbi:retrovirus-related Pol polyprotein from transposon TNT 1-94 [Trichonephila inaurata madagascariensis]|uniref:Retrovirus-related Pol polyprotein from transposon TNT 1-94 n=1 Tax=Trichonephila inaurata madagascariensis TaxID=2747483 RepID=A0A8X6X4W3_9ARAC|nr:retrovirus-related Pol polyprotein from transposon TNT 1-94 [Trichonephila inaurata madagascariensis]
MPYTPQQNGAAECENRTIVESARSIIYATNLPLKLWAETVNMFVYVLNRTGPTSVKDKKHIEPETYKEAMASDRKAIGNMWVFKVKQNADGTVQYFKARHVAKRYSQKNSELILVKPLVL